MNTRHDDEKHKTTLIIGRLCHIGLGFLNFSLILHNSDRNFLHEVV